MIVLQFHFCLVGFWEYLIKFKISSPATVFRAFFNAKSVLNSEIKKKTQLRSWTIDSRNSIKSGSNTALITLIALIFHLHIQLIRIKFVITRPAHPRPNDGPKEGIDKRIDTLTTRYLFQIVVNHLFNDNEWKSCSQFYVAHFGWPKMPMGP